MAATTTAFEAEILAAFPPSQRGLMAGAAYRLRQSYLMGMTDPAAHTNAKMNPKHVNSLNGNGKTTSFDAITAP